MKAVFTRAASEWMQWREMIAGRSWGLTSLNAFRLVPGSPP